ncbi:Mitochondrial aspartate--tRNA ligase [Lachnellula suecica]|uniref:Mitochondrial aspartate--tRNA ligase n=1 Tax=Lachnellula suecica TaxID=602035 RepID=A0A8T9BXA0_9HELO|nr:Mitochondrial aspartate--tRNA ligase [Lachnellula suecica]
MTITSRSGRHILRPITQRYIQLSPWRRPTGPIASSKCRKHLHVSPRLADGKTPTENAFWDEFNKLSEPEKGSKSKAVKGAKAPKAKAAKKKEAIGDTPSENAFWDEFNKLAGQGQVPKADAVKETFGETTTTENPFWDKFNKPLGQAKVKDIASANTPLHEGTYDAFYDQSKMMAGLWEEPKAEAMEETTANRTIPANSAPSIEDEERAAEAEAIQKALAEEDTSWTEPNSFKEKEPNEDFDEERNSLLGEGGSQSQKMCKWRLPLELHRRTTPHSGNNIKDHVDNATPATVPFEKRIPIDLLGTRVTISGFLRKFVKLSNGLAFAHLNRGSGPEYIQILSKWPNVTAKLKSIRIHSAVTVTGTMREKFKPQDSSKIIPRKEKVEPGLIFSDEIEILVEDLTCLNSFDENVHYGPDQVFRPENRHLQIRFDDTLQSALLFRSDVAACVREELKDFHEIETPILFKSTPEGAREFLVPTRKPGFAYALPQSPQQYKQVLMASGISKYMQFARCFRDEDLRADRQPEFTQIDLEMAWTNGKGVMLRVESLIRAIYAKFGKEDTPLLPLSNAPFPRITYARAMAEHGSDKPDLRIPGLIQRIDPIITNVLAKMLTNIENPIIEACKFNSLKGDATEVSKFIGNFLSSPAGEEFTKNPDGAPGIAVFNNRRALEGLQSFGFEAAENLKNLYSSLPRLPFQNEKDHLLAKNFEDGDLILMQARENLPHTGGSTALGRLRLAVYKAAVAEGLLDPDPTHKYLWVTDFPMFTLENGVDPGQGGKAGFSATHHPFTAPKTAADVDLLLTDPLKAKADHYDLVVNGVELGGGSRRIHNADMQTYIMKKVLKMSPGRIKDFTHLLNALRAGCPPHAGLAIGFDRLIAVMRGTDSVRDVIAFPKSSKGEDMLVKSPQRVHRKEWERYHLKKVDFRPLQEKMLDVEEESAAETQETVEPKEEEPVKHSGWRQKKIAKYK